MEKTDIKIHGEFDIYELMAEASKNNVEITLNVSNDGEYTISIIPHTTPMNYGWTTAVANPYYADGFVGEEDGEHIIKDNPDWKDESCL